MFLVLLYLSRQCTYLLSDFNMIVGYMSFLSIFDKLFAIQVICPLVSDLLSPEASILNNTKKKKKGKIKVIIYNNLK